MTKDEALRLALEAFEYTGLKWPQVEEAITAIKAALEAKDEPVALKPCAYESKQKKMCPKCGQVHAEAIWDTTPPQRKPLTDEEIQQIFIANSVVVDNGNAYMVAGLRTVNIARAIEAAHGIKGEA